ncbi:MAG: signal peptidase I [Planctomycetota bacterium]
MPDEPPKPTDRPSRPHAWWAARRERKRAKLEAEKARLAAMSPGHRFLHTVWSWVSAIVVALLVLTPIRVMIIDWNDIPSGSMEPTMLVGDRIVVNKFDYGVRWPIPWQRFWIARWDTPDRGDIVTWHNPDSTAGKTMVKRVLGIPGDHVIIQDGLVTLNGEPLEYEVVEAESVTRDERGALLAFEILKERLPRTDGEYVEHTIQRLLERHTLTPHRVAGTDIFFTPRDRFEFHLADDEFLMIGDNRDRSLDSRFPLYGPVPAEHIYGSSGRVALSLDRGGTWFPRLERTLKGVD